MTAYSQYIDKTMTDYVPTDEEIDKYTKNLIL